MQEFMQEFTLKRDKEAKKTKRASLSKAKISQTLKHLDPDEPLENMTQNNMTIYENYKVQLLQRGTFQCRLRNQNQTVVVMNDIDSYGAFQHKNFVHCSMFQTETGKNFTCECGVYHTLLEELSTDQADLNTIQGPIEDFEGVKCIHCRFLEDFLEGQSADNALQIMVNAALESPSPSVLPLESTEKCRKYSVRCDDRPSFVHLSLHPTTKKYIFSCKVSCIFLAILLFISLIPSHLITGIHKNLAASKVNK